MDFVIPQQVAFRTADASHVSVVGFLLCKNEFIRASPHLFMVTLDQAARVFVVAVKNALADDVPVFCVLLARRRIQIADNMLVIHDHDCVFQVI